MFDVKLAKYTRFAKIVNINMNYMNYSKIVNNVSFIALIVIGAFAGFMIGVKLPAVFASFYPPSSPKVAAVVQAVYPITPPVNFAATTTEPEVIPEVENVPEPIPPSVVPVVVPVKDIGKSDLSVRVLETGIIDKVSNIFVSTTTLHSTDRIAVRFVVENLGTKETGVWYFNAVLPTTYPFFTYVPDGQILLRPNTGIEFTLGFDSIKEADGNVLIINIDPANSISEVSEDNNIVRVTIDGVIFRQ